MTQSRNPSSLTPSSPLAAIAIMILCAALLAAMTLMAKALGRGIGGEPLPPLVISAGRFVFAWLALLPIVLWVRPSFVGAAWPLHGARSVFGWAGVSCMFTAATVLLLADAGD